MKTERELFEKLERVKNILNKYDWFFDLHSNQYVLESYSGDIKCLQASNYLDGLWYMWQAWQASANRQGYKLVPVEPTEEMYLSGYDCKVENGSTIDIYKAMIGAIE